MKTNSNGWQRIPWDGNPYMGLECWRKQFGIGKVSVGIGDFHLVVFSYGPNSDRSFSSTRVSPRRSIKELEAMQNIDKNNGFKLTI
jgi:hypothetical protein